MTTIAVLGDVHGNARALRAALNQARRGPFDRLVLMGDLLTYGNDVEEVLDLVSEAQKRDDAALLIGNHDQMYFDIADGKREYFDGLPDWIKESVDLTLESSAVKELRTRLVWSDEVLLDDAALAAHANPFGAHDWRYLNVAEDHAAAAAALSLRSLTVGVFGHTHRPRFDDGRRPLKVVPFGDLLEAPRSPEYAMVLNAGAVGQPRDGSGRAVILRLSLTEKRVQATFELVDYDIQAHIEALQRTKLSSATIDRLSRFFMPR